jgi:hypothetical protein
VWLELDYDGLQPPIVLLRDLAALGWRPPAVATPPHEAIDWSQPDRERGLDHTIRPWQVVGATVDPPAGHGPRGAWTVDDAATFLPQLDALLDRHGLDAAGTRTTIGPEPSSTGEASPATPTSSDAPEAPDTGVLATFVVEAEAAPAVRAALEADQLAHRTSPATITVPQRYRGRDFTTDVAAVRVEVALPTDAVAALEATLDAVGVDRGLARLQIEPLEPSGRPATGLAEVHPIRPTRGVA